MQFVLAVVAVVLAIPLAVAVVAVADSLGKMIFQLFLAHLIQL
jgi:hypothetical protein